jgi:hypothetical protein
MMRLTRNQLLVTLGTILVLLAVSLWIVRPILGRRRKLAVKIEQSEKRLQELISLERLYQEMKAESGKIESNLSQRPNDFTLFAFLEGLAGRDGIKGQIEFMTAPEQVRIRRLTIRPQQRNPSELEVSLLVVTRKLSEAVQAVGSKET